MYLYKQMRLLDEATGVTHVLMCGERKDYV